MKRRLCSAVGVGVMSVVLLAGCGADTGGDAAPSVPPATEDAAPGEGDGGADVPGLQDADGDAPEAPAAPVTDEVPSEPDAAEDAGDDGVSSEFKSALRSAEQYLSFSPMSKAGLFDQLVSEYGGQFAEDAAQYAVDNVEANWKENALQAAEDYQSLMAMSPEAIRDQLVSEYGGKFTQEEADWAVANLS